MKPGCDASAVLTKPHRANRPVIFFKLDARLQAEAGQPTLCGIGFRRPQHQPPDASALCVRSNGEFADIEAIRRLRLQKMQPASRSFSTTA